MLKLLLLLLLVVVVVVVVVVVLVFCRRPFLPCTSPLQNRRSPMTRFQFSVQYFPYYV